METSLHRQLKQHYAGADAATEVPLGSYRIDAVTDGLLVEVQHGPLIAIRRKIADLLNRHDVLIVKPLILHKTLVKQERRDGPVLGRRRSPRRGRLTDFFDELVHFTRVFPHPRLRVDLALVDVEEWRVPRRRRRGRDYRVTDQLLDQLVSTIALRQPHDLWQLLPTPPPPPFDTGDLARHWELERHETQRIAYCLRHAQAIQTVGKRGNAWLYEPVPQA